MSGLVDLHGVPDHLRSDNGSEFIEAKLRTWLAENKSKKIYNNPGSPWQKGYIESFNARLQHYLGVARLLHRHHRCIVASMPVTAAPTLEPWSHGDLLG